MSDSKPSSARPKSADAIVTNLDFDKQLKTNLAIFIPLLFVSLAIVGVGPAYSTMAVLEILEKAENDTKVYKEIKNGSVPKASCCFCC